MDAARAFLASDEGQEQLDLMVKNSMRLKEQLANLRNVEVYIPEDPMAPHTQQDMTRFLVKVHGKTPNEVVRMCLDKYKIDPEKQTEKATLFSFLIGHERHDYDRLYEVMREIDRDANSWPALEEVPMRPIPRIQQFCDLETMSSRAVEQAQVGECLGRVSADDIFMMPPGFAVLHRGEFIT